MVQINHTLPWSYDTLEPYIDTETVHFHFDKHHQGYVSRYNLAVQSQPDLIDLSLEDALNTLSAEIKSGQTDRMKLFQDGSQAWNHNFFWNSMKPGTQISDHSNNLIAQNFPSSQKFTSYGAFIDTFVQAGKSFFGSGWLWLVKYNNTLDLCLTKDADSPNFTSERVTTLNLKVDSTLTTPLFVCDLWEHAYYLKYKNDRENYIRNFITYLVNWDLVV